MPAPLEKKIRDLITQTGPISVADYFAICLADPEFGYYMTKDPFGVAGDFTTAPEISQLFGEMIGVYLVQSWQTQAPVGPIRIIEIGPGRGTLMADALRVIAKLAPSLLEQATVHMVETSPKLRKIQKETLANYEDKLSWHNSFEDVPGGFFLLLANELFDAIPLRQFIKTDVGFRERTVTVNASDELAFSVGVAGIDSDLLPSNHKDQPAGTVFEIAPARVNVMTAIATRLVKEGGSALVIDYGYLATGFGDTLQAIHKHEFDPPLANPGQADLTSHVDFEMLMRTAHAAGAHIHGVMYQGDFLVGLGLLQRAGMLGQDKDHETQQEIRSAVERLVGEGSGNMGELFKVLAMSGQEVKLAPFVAQMDDPESANNLN
ncbi:class I SAM-dependent methyltransferase [Lentilitoribacter sp. EG35]|uniref:class I SAM-dependent methyltransferase n=1 Tax=Lentilitoribacter sp. EG35 TaxID=3234192 RepID=UPI00346141C4